ncbi:hypothetical protein [Yinghuangia soli]|uniref:Immunity protein 35 domain-containing protein n=1 Tax=Yinghuangia soli TaxID=2908204 RepID=A0AA41TXX9_9ACTN|nr:hypothetical protein [Yinghuangia soli]MCF2525796.1 hypothetical protein [Yinghuangia soli]
MTTREQALAAVDALTARDSRRWSRPGAPISVERHEVEQHRFGWLVSYGSHVPTDDRSPVAGGFGKYLVEYGSGRIFHVGGVPSMADDWEDDYVVRLQGRHVPDEFETAARAALAVGGRMAALRELRRMAPRLTITEAKSYVDVLEAGGEPPRLAPLPERRLLLVEPLNSDVDVSGHEEMWTTERDDWYLAATYAGGVLLPVNRVDGMACLICDEEVADRVIAHMLRAGVEVVYDARPHTADG